MDEIGTTFWITGLSGAGKTTIGSMLYRYIKKTKGNIVLLDGDEIRNLWQSMDYSIDGRRTVTYQMSRLAKMLNEQNIDCVCCIVGMINECRAWNRRNIKKYKEVYLKVPIDVLIKRDQKNLYSKALAGEIKNVWGVDLNPEEPMNPDFVIENDGKMEVHEIFDELLRQLKLS